MEFIVYGRCVPKERPRFAKHTYTPKKTQDYEAEVRRVFLESECDVDPDGMIELSVCVYRKIPEDKKKKIKNGDYCRIGGDGDNYLKTIQDALNGVAYTDDRQIVKASVTKIWAETPKARITIRNARDW